MLAWVVSGSYFLSDDYLNFARATELGFREWVNGELFGHWLPARKALDWGLNGFRPISWAATVAVLVMFVGVAALLTRLVVLRLTASPAWANVALIVLPLTCAVPGTVQWYAGAAQVIPAITCASAVLLTVVWLPAFTGWGRLGMLVALLVALGVGLLFDERTAVIAAVAPALLPLIVRGRRLWSAVLVSYLSMIPFLMAWYVVQSRMTSGSNEAFAPFGTVAAFMVTAVIQNAVPSLFGWVTRPALWGEGVLWPVAGVLLILLAVLVFLSRSRAKSAWAIGVWLTGAALTAAPTALIRAEQFGVSAALEPRYIAMAMPLGVIALAYVGSTLRTPTKAGRLAAAAVTAVLVAALAANLVHLQSNTAGESNRAWAERFVRTAEESRTVHFYNVPVAGFVIPWAFYPYNLAGAVLPQVYPPADTVVTSDAAGFVTSDGTVRVISPSPVGVASFTGADGFAQSPSEGSAGCYVASPDGGRLSFAAPEMPANAATAVISVHGAFTDTGLRVVTGPDWSKLRDKTAGVGGHSPVPGSAVWVTTEELPDMRVIGIDVQPNQTVCIESVQIGTLPAVE
ncbi:hypothetical protein JNB63_05020 [Microbacterium trichothecenolyticum]|uniref:hypothetical protein n=1 Tax=Microbacterium trichothecenolyticum TaxID=69370 RepID=UPI001C6E334F|nr:hypothetical protein [Microbacterium trichothecenolyticum]MBW9119449.1 hypothetical protein [Microbacterium trichothecenolyticum]